MILSGPISSKLKKIVKIYHFVDVSDFFCILLFVKNSRQNYISELDK